MVIESAVIRSACGAQKRLIMDPGPAGAQGAKRERVRKLAAMQVFGPAPQSAAKRLIRAAGSRWIAVVMFFTAAQH